jgi:hypothetical protein
VKNSDIALLADPQNILCGWKIHFSQFFNVRYVGRQLGLHAVESLVPGHSSLNVAMAIVKVGKSKSPISYQLQAEVIQGRAELVRKVIHFVCNKEELPDQWKKSVVVTFKDITDKIYYNYYLEISLLVTPYKCY